MTARNTNARRLGALATVAAAAALALPAAASAAVTGTVTGNTATLTGDAAADTIIISVDNGLLRHNNLAGFNSNSDFDSAVAGDQQLTAAAGTLTINGGDGDDIIVAGPNNDVVNGDGGNDRMTGFTGADDMNGGLGNDLMQWNNGDGSDTNDGDAGVDETLITGRNTTDDMTVANNGAGRHLFTRAAPGGFTVDMAVERLTLTPFQGDDKLVTQPDVTLPMTVQAGPGLDTITTGAGTDLIEGGEDVDTLNGGAGGDRILGNPGNDNMNGDAGDDTLVWFNGDGTDNMNGGDGLDRIEDNLGAANDVSQLKVENGIVRYDRINAPFGLNITNSEVFGLNTFGGDDTLDVAPGVGALIAVTADGGEGNDRFNGGDEADTFLGGLGDDTLDPGTGSDTANGQDGNDTLKLRDGIGDLAVGGTGTDSATVDSLDAVAADVENVDRSKSGAKALKIDREARVNKRYKAELGLSCDESALEGCKGRLTLTVKVKIGGKKVEAYLAKARYDLDAGESKKIEVRIPKDAKKYAKKHRLKVKATALARNAAGDYTIASKYVTLEFPKKKK